MSIDRNLERKIENARDLYEEVIAELLENIQILQDEVQDLTNKCEQKEDELSELKIEFRELTRD